MLCLNLDTIIFITFTHPHGHRGACKKSLAPVIVFIFHVTQQCKKTKTLKTVI